ncbi:ferritin-like protein [Bradyrhizobium sp.]|uniref:ferritin-like domain-containing protein n=1 Tax=Bradyrhizobium sp. TaxID=376 RepID=UPI002E0CCD69|nr:ferritin-like protein [Bradyrhizobium sp.]
MLRIDPVYVAAARNAKSGADLHEPLQKAIELELSTIPPYLTAVYSIMPGTNKEIKRTIFKVAKEEMLHMTIVANVLNAVDGRPLIADPKAAPVYPGPLPMNIGGSLQVGLKKFSVELVHDVFMKIEAPETIIPFSASFATIGEFYRSIIEKIDQLGDAIFTGDPGRQVVDEDSFPSDQLYAITDAATAVKALKRVVEDGEGTTLTPLDVDGKFAHFYLFEGIYRGAELVVNPAAQNGYSYTGNPLIFDPTGVWDIPDNPKAADYPVGSAERTKVDGFNKAYSNMLRGLQNVFDGSPGGITGAVGAMSSLRELAESVVSTPDSHTGKQLGLPFEYVP